MRILEYFNLSNNKNLSADSGYRVFRQKVEYTLNQRSDYHFYFISPFEHFTEIRRDMEQWKHNVTILPVKMLSANNGSRFYVDIKNIEELLQPDKRDYDILSVQEPSVVGALLELCNGFNHWKLPVFSYVHWICEDVSIKINTHERLSYLAGLYLSDICACNSSFGKGIILGQASEYYNSDFVDAIDKKLRVIPPASDVQEVLKYKIERPLVRDKIRMIFNHRLNVYTGYRLVLTELKKLYTLRQDFEVVFTNPSKMTLKDQEEVLKLPFVQIKDLDRKSYFEELWKSDICFACHEGTNQWSIALVEAVCAGCVPLAGTLAFQKELLRGFEDTYFYTKDNEFLPKLQYIMDNIDDLQAEIECKQEGFAQRWCIENIIHTYNDIYDELHEQGEIVQADCDSMNKIRSTIEKYKTITKKQLVEQELGWSDFIGWSKYRRRILKEFEDDDRNRDTIYCVKGERPFVQGELF